MTNISDMYHQVQVLKQSLEHQREELNECRAEITSLKMHIEGSLSGRNLAAADIDHVQSQIMERYKEEIKLLQQELETLKAKNLVAPDFLDLVNSKEEPREREEVVDTHEDKDVLPQSFDSQPGIGDGLVSPSRSPAVEAFGDDAPKPQEVLQDTVIKPSPENPTFSNGDSVAKQNGEVPNEDSGILTNSDDLKGGAVEERMVS